MIVGLKIINAGRQFDMPALTGKFLTNSLFPACDIILFFMTSLTRDLQRSYRRRFPKYKTWLKNQHFYFSSLL